MNQHIRAKPDEVIAAIADTGGYVGICCIPEFLGRGRDLNALLYHIGYVLKRFGADHVAIGTDISHVSIFSKEANRKSPKKPPARTRYEYFLAARLSRRRRPRQPVVEQLADVYRWHGDARPYGRRNPPNPGWKRTSGSACRARRNRVAMSRTIQTRPLHIPVLVACALGGFVLNSLGQQVQNEADLVLRHGKVVTMDAARPEAEAVAVRDHLILAVGSNREIQRFIGRSTRIIDLAGNLAVPGFIEGHGHFLSLGESKETLDLTKTKSWDEIVFKVQEAVRQSQPGKWITGQGWHQEKWDKRPNPTVEGFPTHQALSAVSAQNPVLFTHASGHASVANARAMELSGVTNKTADPAGGEIVRDSRGNPTGVFRETAQALIRRNRQENRTPQQQDADRQVGLACEPRMPFQRDHELSGCGFLIRGRRALPEACFGRRAWNSVMGDGTRKQ
jgi:hypothetical protein